MSERENKKTATFRLLLFLVEATGCGCPGDTSVRSTEVLTEAAAETSNLRHHRLRRFLRFPKFLSALERHRNFDRCAIIRFRFVYNRTSLLRFPKFLCALERHRNFDRCAISPSLPRPLDAVGLNAQSKRLLCSQNKKQ